MSTAPEDAPRKTIPSDGADKTGSADYPPTPISGAGRARRPGFRVNWRGLLTEALVPLLAIVTALAIGALIIVATGASVGAAYSGLFFGALGTPQALANTLVEATPYIFAGLAVADGALYAAKRLGRNLALLDLGRGRLRTGSGRLIESDESLAPPEAPVFFA